MYKLWNTFTNSETNLQTLKHFYKLWNKFTNSETLLQTLKQIYKLWNTFTNSETNLQRQNPNGKGMYRIWPGSGWLSGLFWKYCTERVVMCSLYGVLW